MANIAGTHNLDQLPQAYDYSHIIKVEAPDNDHIKATDGRVGINIDPQYIKKLTPEQKKKIIAVTVLSLAIIGAVICLAIGLTKNIKPLSYVSIPLGIIAVGTAIYLATRKPDMKSPKVREKQAEKAAQMSWKQLTQTYQLSDVTGYDLLSKARPIADAKEKATFYAKIEKLWGYKKSYEGSRNADLGKVSLAFNTDTAEQHTKLNIALSHARSKQNNGALISSLGTSATISGVNPKNPSVAKTVLGVGATVVGQMEKEKGIADEAAARKEYEITTGPARAKQTTLLQAIHNAADTAEGLMQTYYGKFISGAA